SFFGTLPPPFDHPPTRSEPAARVYEEVLHLWESTASQLDGMAARLRLLAHLSNNSADNIGLDSLLSQATLELRRMMNADFSLLGLEHSENGHLHVKAFDGADDFSLSDNSLESLADAFWEQVTITNQRRPAKFAGGGHDVIVTEEWKAAQFGDTWVIPIMV